VVQRLGGRSGFALNASRVVTDWRQFPLQMVEDRLARRTVAAE
jgi:hypothetical protein